MVWYLWILVGLTQVTCHIWLTRFMLSTDVGYETSPILLGIVCFLLAIPVCFVILVFGTVWKALNWVTK